MPLTGSIALSISTATAQQLVNVVCTISNAGGSALNITLLRPTLADSTSGRESIAGVVGLPPVGPGQTVLVPSGGSITVPWSIIAHAPSGRLGTPVGFPASFSYAAGAQIGASDGTSAAATTATLTVNPG